MGWNRGGNDRKDGNYGGWKGRNEGRKNEWKREEKEGGRREIFANRVRAEEKQKEEVKEKLTEEEALNIRLRTKKSINEGEIIISQWKNAGSYHPNQITFNTLIQLCSKSGDIRKAEYYLDVMEKSGYSANQFTLNSILQCCAMKTLPIVAERHFQQLTAKFEPDAISFTILINLYKRCILSNAKGKGNSQNSIYFAKIEELLEKWVNIENENCKIDLILINSIIDVCKRAGEIEKGEKYFEWMIRRRIAPDAVTFLALIGLCSHRGDLPKALKYYNYMLKFEIPITREIVNSLLSVCAFSGDTAKAEEFFGLLPSHLPPSIVTFNSLINCYCKANDVKKAKEVLNRAIAANLTPTQYSFAPFLKYYNRHGDRERAQKLTLILRSCLPSANPFDTLDPDLPSEKKFDCDPDQP